MGYFFFIILFIVIYFNIQHQPYIFILKTLNNYKFTSKINIIFYNAIYFTKITLKTIIIFLFLNYFLTFF